MRRSCALFVAFLAGCAVGPDFKRPAPPSVERYTSEREPPAPNGQRFVQGADIPAQWWSLFHSEPLNALVEQSLKANPGLQAAEAALRVAQESYLAQRAALFPAAEASYSPTRQKVPDALTSPLNSGASVFSLHTAQLTVSYAPDVFGGVRRQVESAEALAESQRFQLEAAQLALTSNVVAAAIQEAALRGQVAATETVVKIESEQVELMKHQLELGAIAESALIAQRTTLAQARATLAPLRRQLAQQRNLLAALSGRFPSEDIGQGFELSALELPMELPLSLPSKLVEQRPDVRAAEAQLHAASAQIGVATTNMLPQFAINANVGSVATALGSLFSSGTGFWALAANATQPIFQGGALVHRKRAAEAAYDEAAAQYRSTVIGAFQNVADALRALQYDGEALQAAADARSLAEDSLGIARRQLELGDISYLALLGAEQAYQQAVLAHVQAQASRYADVAALFQALGGGWWNR